MLHTADYIRSLHEMFEVDEYRVHLTVRFISTKLISTKFRTIR
jgi:hypothetical protein